MLHGRALAATAAALSMSLALTEVASAACTRLAFSVNDYGKVGPTNDAKNLLDRYIAKWTSERNIRNYRVGPKEVTCELFLDVIVFDEYTCKAAATVCWDGPLPKNHETEAGVTPPAPNVNRASQRPKAPTPKAAEGATGTPPAPIATGSVRPAAPKTPAPPAPAAAPPPAPAAAPAN